MRRGDLVIIAQKGVYEGKPRPVVVIQADDCLEDASGVVVCLVTGEDEAVTGPFQRVAVMPSVTNGLRKASIVMADRITTIRRENIGARIGCLDGVDLGRLDAALILFLGLR